MIGDTPLINLPQTGENMADAISSPHTSQMTINPLPSNQINAMSEYTLVTKYARYNEKLQRRETWPEMVNRIRDMHKFRYGARGINNEIDWAFEQVREKRVLPSMRSLQYGGEAIIANDARIYNCSYSLADRPRFFSECLWLLLSGVGAGFSVQKQHIEKLPKLVTVDDPTEKEVMTYTIGDTIEGWADALQILIDSYFQGTPLSGKEIFFDYTRIRRKGSKLKTSGGRAPGPKPLQLALKKIKRVLLDAIEAGQEKLRPIQVYDIIMIAGDCVLAGGIRRSATIAIFSPDDDEMMKAKVEFYHDVRILSDKFKDGKYITEVGTAYNLYLKDGSEPKKGDIVDIGWYNLYPWRQLSNNSVALLRNKCSFNDFEKVINNAKSYGEPGFVFLDDLNYGYNPCLTGDTKLLTDRGYVNLKELWKEGGCQEYDKHKNIDEYGFINIVNSNGVVRATNVYKTSNSSPVYEVELNDNRSIKATANHKFFRILENGNKERVNLSELLIGDKLPLIDKTFDLVKSITFVGDEPTYCLTEPENNEITANGVIIGNCVEVGINPVDRKTGNTGWGLCVSGDTTLITRNGRINIKDAVGKEIEIWNGKNWSKVTPFITGKDRKLFRVAFNDGSYLDCTDNHKFLVADRFSINYKEVMTKDLMNTSKYSIHVPRSNIIYDESGYYEDKAYEYGFLLGDGTVSVKNYTNKVYTNARLCGSKINLPLRGSRCDQYEDENYNVNLQNIDLHLDIILSAELKNHNIGLPDVIFSWDKQSIINFISGWADADGNEHNYGCRIYGEEKKIRDLQLLLTKVGINSSVNLMSRKGEKTNFGERSRDVWYAFLPNAKQLNTHRLDLFNGKDNQHSRSKWQIIESVTELPGLHDTYCLNEPCEHCCVFNNVLTKQCNLTEINGGMIKTKEDFKDAVKAATIIGTLQSGYTYLSYLADASRNVVRGEALLGVSVTGWMDNPKLLLDPELQREMAEYAIQVNKEYAEKINVNQAARVTCTKPAGTTSIIFGTGSGIHPHHARHYFRRVRVNKNQPYAQFFKLFNPHMVEESKSNKNDEIITFCIQVPESAILKNDLNAIDFLKMVKKTYENWVLPGTARPDSSPDLTHNVSNTVTVKIDEWDDVTKFIYDNRKCFSGISLLADFGDKIFEQAPMEKLSNDKDVAKWNDIVLNYRPIDWSSFTEIDDFTERQQTIACANGKCEV